AGRRQAPDRGGGSGGDRPEDPEDAAPVANGPGEHSRQHSGAERMELELEGRDDAEVAAPSPKTPEQIGILLLARDDELAVGGDDVARAQIVDRQAELAHEVADAAAQGQPSDPRVA